MDFNDPGDMFEYAHSMGANDMRNKPGRNKNSSGGGCLKLIVLFVGFSLAIAILEKILK